MNKLFLQIVSRKRASLKALFLILLAYLVYVLIPFNKPLFTTDYSTVVKSEDGELLRVFLNKDEQWCLPPEDSLPIPDKLKTAVQYYEDEYFYWHPGVNLVSIFRAMKQNISAKRVVSGASTLTMQVCRIRNPKERTFFHKVLEILEATKLDLRYSKENILKMYLNHAPYGGNIQGYRAAAFKYFGKSAKELSWAEAATLAILPNAPGLVSPGKKNNMVIAKRNSLLRKLYEKEIIDSSTYALAKLETLPNFEFYYESIAPHLSRKLHADYPKEKIINTTVNRTLQQFVAEETRYHSSYLKRKGIHNASVLVLDTETGAVKAYIGSQDFFDFQNQGQVDGVMAPRSSGSILKPFLYALCIDDGIILPSTQIHDIPSYFDAFSPNNADKKFSGIIRANEALIRSLNIPAVRLLNTYGVYTFYSFLKTSGVSTLFRTSDDYGLPLIIGGAEVSLYDMAMLYRSVANMGVFEEIYACANDTFPERRTTPQLISGGASYLTLEMLKEVKRPGVEYYWQRFESRRPIAWKTGTSYGQKDAWAIGVTPEWTVAVWVGNFDGEGNPELSGAQSAGPLLFEIMNHLEYSANKKWFDKIEMDFNSARICKQTGYYAGEFCNEVDTVDAPIFAKPLRMCPFHRPFFVDTIHNIAVCSQCWGKNYIQRNYCVYPSEVVHHLRLRGQETVEIPFHNPNCIHKTEIEPLAVVYPNDSALIWIPTDFDSKIQKLVAKASHQKASSTVYWYLDQKYWGATKNIHRVALELSKGWHSLYVNDEYGYEDSVKFFIGKH